MYKIKYSNYTIERKIICILSNKVLIQNSVSINVQMKSTIIVTLILVASVAGTMASLPQMIGTASAAACPNGQPPQQGKCVTVVGPAQCPQGTTQTPGTNTCEEQFSSSGTAARQECNRLGGHFNPSTKTCTGIPQECPSGGQPQNGECVIFTKPGSG